tara:strand:- start:725 stop:853 length:129 start_codon:yes stop_codon:yes gene_type:complete
MKNRYIIYFLITVTIILFIGLYIIEIPTPSAIFTENYNLNLK